MLADPAIPTSAKNTRLIPAARKIIAKTGEAHTSARDARN